MKKALNYQLFVFPNSFAVMRPVHKVMGNFKRPDNHKKQGGYSPSCFCLRKKATVRTRITTTATASAMGAAYKMP